MSSVADQVDYQVEYLYQIIESDDDAGIQTWLKLFKLALDRSHFDESVLEAAVIAALGFRSDEIFTPYGLLDQVSVEDQAALGHARTLIDDILASLSDLEQEVVRRNVRSTKELFPTQPAPAAARAAAYAVLRIR